MKPNHKNLLLAAISLTLTLTLTAPTAFAGSYYWDTDGVTPGSGGATPNGTWGTLGTTWSTDSTGAAATSAVTTSGIDDLFFSAGTNATGSYSITLGANPTNAKSLTFEEGTATIGTVGGANTLALAGGGGITVATTASGATISSAFTLNGNNTFNIGSGETLTVNGTTFTRGTRAALNVQGAGTVAASGALGTLLSGTIAPWASVGTGASTQYATISAGNITGLTGTAAADASAVTDTGGTFNYDVAAVGTLGAGANINTLRYTGAAGTIAGALTTKGIMNAGSGILTFSGAVTSGAAGTEMVVNAANGDITMSGASAIYTGTLNKTGSSTFTLANVANVLTTLTVNEGTLITQGTTADAITGFTVNSGGTLKFGTTSDYSNTATAFVVNSGGTLDLNGISDTIGAITGSGTITNTYAAATVVNLARGSATAFSGVIQDGTGAVGLVYSNSAASGSNNQILTGLNTFTGQTTIAGATYGISINSIGNVVVGGPGIASALGAPISVANGTIGMGSAASGGTLIYTGTGNDTNRVINLAGTTGGATLDQSGASGLLKFTSALTATGIGSKTLTLQGSTAGTGEIAGAIVDNNTGGGFLTSLTKAGTGTWTLSGTNTYSGATAVNVGVLNFANKAAKSSSTTVTAAAAGTVGLGVKASDAAYFSATDVGDLFNGTLAGFTLDPASGVAIDTTNAGGTFDQTVALTTTTRSLTKLGTGTLQLSGANTYTGATTIKGGTLQLSGSGKLNGGSYAGAILVASGTTFENAGTTSQTLSGAITGGGTLSISGGGQLILSNSGNAYGALTVSNSNARVFINNNAGALPSAATVNITNGNLVFGFGATRANAISVSSGATLTARNATTLSGTVTLPGSGSVIFNNDDSNTNLLTINNGQTLTGNLNVQIGANRMTAGTTSLGAVTLSGKLTGSGPLTVTSGGLASNVLFGTGTLNLTNASNDYTGGTILNRGTISLGTNGTLGATTGALQVNNTNTTRAGGTDAVLNLATAVDTTVGTLSGSISTPPTSGTNTATINTGGSGINFTVNQTADGTYAGSIAGAGGFTLGSLSTNTLTLTGTNSYTGSTTVSAGTLLVNGNQSTATGTVTVASTATLGGTGTLGGATTVNGSLAPGDGVGQLTFTGGLTFGSLATNSLKFQLGANTTAGTTYDTVTTNTLDIGASLDFADFQFTDTGTLAAGTYTLINSGAAISGSIGTASGTIGALNATLSISGGNTLILTVASSNPYTTWAGGAGFYADANGDGVPSGLAWILGAGGPNDNALSFLPTPGESSGALTMTFTQVNPMAPAKLFVEYSNDLGVSDPWHSVQVPTSSGTVFDVTFTITGTSPQSVTLSVPSSKAAGGKLFGRLRSAEN